MAFKWWVSVASRMPTELASSLWLEVWPAFNETSTSHAGRDPPASESASSNARLIDFELRASWRPIGVREGFTPAIVARMIDDKAFDIKSLVIYDAHMHDALTKATPAVDMAATAVYPDLAGKVAVVTGGSRGLGAETARALGKNGVSVTVVGRDHAALAAVVKDITSAGGEAFGVMADCIDERDLAELGRAVEEEFGCVDILAAFAGGNGMPVPTATESGAHWREVIETDLTSTFLTVSTFLSGMIARQSGTIITMSSSAGRQAAQSAAAYAAAKAGVIAFTRHLAGEHARDGIRVNCIAPSAIENERMRAWMSDDERKALGAAFPLGRIGQPYDVAAAALFLASSASSWITGTTLDIAGGKVML
jgi:3-oxoacyl-[acyl-carrier protein] reductase